MVERDNEPSDLRPRVLLADDHESLLAALTRLIEPTDAVVGAVCRGAQALEVAARFQPDVIVIDVNLPDITGLEVCRRVTASELLAHVVMVTAADDPDVEQRALALGASAFVLKYRTGDDLLPAIEAALATRSRR